LYLNKYIRIGILIVIILIMHSFFRKERRKEILKSKPMIYNHIISKIISIVFLIIGVFFHYFNADIVRNILK
jgi:hypothetical protein